MFFLMTILLWRKIKKIHAMKKSVAEETTSAQPPREVIKDYCKVVMEINKRETQLPFMRGRAVYNRDETQKELLFVENTPRGKRSREIGRTLHSRSVQRADGDFTVTFRIRAGDKNLKYWMQSEARDVVKLIESV